MIITAYVIAALVGLGIIYIGVSYLFAPMTVAPAFGFRAPIDCQSDQTQLRTRFPRRWV